MQPSPLQLRGYFLKELQFALEDPLDAPTVENVEFGSPTLSIESDVKLLDPSERLWRCELTVACKRKGKEPLPYTFKVVFVGFMNAIEAVPEDKVEQIVRVNSPALLYSAAREVVLSLTSRGPGPALVLPSVTFLPPPAEPKRSQSGPSRAARSRKASPKLAPRRPPAKG